MQKLITLVLLSGVWSIFAEARCVSFFHVKRPVTLSLVWHEYVASESGNDRAVYGLPKPGDDLALFSRFREGETRLGLQLQYLGESCDGQAEEIAARVSHSWQTCYKNWIPFIARMTATPVMGKPCRNSALDVGRQIKPYLN